MRNHISTYKIGNGSSISESSSGTVGKISTIRQEIRSYKSWQQIVIATVKQGVPEHVQCRCKGQGADWGQKVKQNK